MFYSKHHLITLVCAGLLLAGPVAAQTFFEDATGESGRTLHSVVIPAWGDYDNDGWPDLLLNSSLAHNEAGRHFAERLHANPLQHLSGLFGDYDNDGDLDLVHMGAFATGMSVLGRNDRGVFTNIALEAGLSDSLRTLSLIWLDYDRDGFLDLYEANIAEDILNPNTAEEGLAGLRNRLYRNKGNGTFEDMTEAAGLGGLNPGEGHFNLTMAAGDFNDDGWPDLYVGVSRGPNRLFFNEQGHFQEVRSGEILVAERPTVAAVGDIDNDGDLDLFQATNTLNVDPGFRSVMLKNEGGGNFLDVTEGVGLVELARDSRFGAGLADIDNDGDLDLLTTRTHTLYLNNGDGTFVEATDRSGITEGTRFSLVWGDYNLDGFLDVFIAAGAQERHNRLYRNKGNGNHWLRIELVGVQSNRNGIGTRVFAQAGDLRQMRELLGSMGEGMHEMVVHFGLGPHTQVDRLEIRWPSGQVDVLTEIAADQKIRIIEGREDYHTVHPTIGEITPLVAGVENDLELVVRPALFSAGAEISRVVADLSELGGPEEVALTDVGDGTYRLEIKVFTVAVPSRRNLDVWIEQTTPLGPHWTKFSRLLTILPPVDLVVFDEVLAPDWQMESSRNVEAVDLESVEVVHTGGRSGAFQIEESPGTWRVQFQTAVPVSPVGYSLRFVFHPGDIAPSSASRFSMFVNSGNAFINLLAENWVDLELREWQVVEIPTDAFSPEEPIKVITFSGTFGGTFYLDDIRLVTAAPSSPAGTAILEEHTATLPHCRTLSPSPKTTPTRSMPAPSFASPYPKATTSSCPSTTWPVSRWPRW